jgi:hypothetical protein
VVGEAFGSVLIRGEEEVGVVGEAGSAKEEREVEEFFNMPFLGLGST